MNRPPPDLIIFDLGRVLVEFDFKKVVRNLKRYTFKTEKDIHAFFRQTPLWDEFERGQVIPKDFFKKLQKELRLEGLTFEAFVPIWNEIFTEKPDTVAILRKLRGRYRLALLSNVNTLHWDYLLDRHLFMHWFNHPIASCLVGRRKPDSEVYRLTLRRAGVSPQRAVFIDDMSEHIAAAQALGICAYRFHNAPQLRLDLDGILE